MQLQLSQMIQIFIECRITVGCRWWVYGCVGCVWCLCALCVWRGVCGVRVVEVVDVRTFVLHEGVCPATRTVAPNSGGRTPGGKLPGLPPPLPRPDGGGQPWPCACAHGPKKSDPSTSNTGTSTSLSESQRQLRRLHSFLRCQDHPGTCRCTTTSMSTNPCPQAVSACNVRH